MKTLDILKENLETIINKLEYNATTKKLKTDIAIEFSRKGLSAGIPNQIMGGNYILDELERNELLLFTMCLYNSIKDESINPCDYFYPNAINELKEKEIISEYKELVFKIKAIKREDKEEYVGYIDLYQISDIYRKGLLSYNLETQRQATYKKTKTGQLLVKPTVNKHSVKQISDLMYDNKYEGDAIVFNVRRIEGKRQNIEYDDKTLELIITLNFDEDSDTQTILDVIDGFHRTNSAIWAVKEARKTNKRLTNKLPLVIKNLNTSEAKSFVSRGFIRNPEKKEYIKALAENDKFNLIVREINDWGTPETNILKDKIGNTAKEVQFLGKYTTIDYMMQGLKLSSFKFEDSFLTRQSIKTIVNIVSEFISCMIHTRFNGDIEEMKSNSQFFNPKIFIGYIALADVLKDKSNYIDLIPNICEELYNNIDYRKLGLNKNKLMNKVIFDYFFNLV